MNLFERASGGINDKAPLAYRMRPRTLEEFAGQEHLVGPEGPIRKMVDADQVHPFILFGPPGSGKTTLALIIAQSTRAHFDYLKAVSSGVTDLRNAARDAEQRLSFYGQRTILFVDEIHRFNKAQQDVLLPYVESGALILIGATTENPLYEINSALLSRMKIYTLNPLTPDSIKMLVQRALDDSARGLGGAGTTIDADAVEEIVGRSKGDARVSFNLLETAWQNQYQGDQETVHLTKADIVNTAGQFFLNYDRKDEWHYDVASAFIKSIRGSDPDASLFWLAVMIHGGEDPLFIARRLVVHAAEDIGLADPQALVVAVSAFHATNFIGMPEARIPLAEATLYLATAPKSNSSKAAIDKALDFVASIPSVQVPGHIADNSHSKSHLLGKGSGYKYPHTTGGYVSQRYLPEGIDPDFYKPSGNGHEKDINRFLLEIKKNNGNE